MLEIKTSSFLKRSSEKKIVHYETEGNPLERENWVYFDEYFLESENIEEEISKIIKEVTGINKPTKINDNIYYVSDDSTKYHIFEVKSQ